jgi:hypothetical protein
MLRYDHQDGLCSSKFDWPLLANSGHQSPEIKTFLRAAISASNSSKHISNAALNYRYYLWGGAQKQRAPHR